MKVALVHSARLPVAAYGGTERVVWWLSKALATSGIEVTLVCAPESECPWATVATADFDLSIENQFPGIDLFHYFNTPKYPPKRPYVVTIEGNGKPGEAFLVNTAFVSRNHARRHGAECFVYNGIDPDDYLFSENKTGSLLFLAKAAWAVKNVRGAIRIARAAHRELEIVGGSRWLFKHWRGVHWNGMLGGKAKAEKIARSSGLLFPVLWNEPFGIAVVEALVSGTPVLASPMGSLPELVEPSVGRICRTEEEFVDAVGSLEAYRPQDCRDYALSRFSYIQMATDYLRLYEKVLEGQSLNPTIPVTQDPLEALQSLPFHLLDLPQTS